MILKLFSTTVLFFTFKSQKGNEESGVRNDDDSTDVHVDGDDDTQNRNIPRPASAKGQRRRPKNDNGDGMLLKLPTMNNGDRINKME